MPAIISRARLATGAVAIALATAAPAASAATFAAAATGGLSLVSITGDASRVTFSTSDLINDSIARTGIATGFKDAFVGYLFDPIGLGTGLEVRLEASVDGSAGTVPPGSSVQASAVASSFLQIFNGGASPVDIVFDFSYSLDTSVFETFGPLLLNDALAEASFILGIDGVEELTFAFSDLVGGPESDFMAATFQRTLSLAAGQRVFLDLTASTFGVAEVTVVPVPAAAWLLLSALGTVAAVCRRVA
jgi:hypothetical protein